MQSHIVFNKDRGRVFNKHYKQICKGFERSKIILSSIVEKCGEIKKVRHGMHERTHSTETARHYMAWVNAESEMHEGDK
jgi:hypothetical protein